jgi:hypothetical protein
MFLITQLAGHLVRRAQLELLALQALHLPLLARLEYLALLAQLALHQMLLALQA